MISTYTLSHSVFHVRVMRLLTWNINGIRTLPLYHPWNTLKTGENILNELNADIICFQEMKSSRQALEKHVAVPNGYDAFFSFPQSKGGYSGVGVYTKRSSAVPLKAEEGLSGRLQSGLKPPLSADERVSPDYPQADDIDLMPDEENYVPLDLIDLDKEGRALVLDFGLFVLINLYCPNETSDARLPYKVNFHRLLSERVRRLTDVEGRQVIVTGDINVCAAPVDHCDGELASKQGEDFYAHPARKWFFEWLAPRGPMVDVVRNCWPERKGMFTCWNQKIDARVSNYGTRIDYFLVTKGLLPWFKHGDIQPSIKGSDHCPVYIDLHDEITTSDGTKISLRDVMKMNDNGDALAGDAPRLASKYWDEYSGKQKLLLNFFGKKTITRQSSVDAIKEPPVEGNGKEEDRPDQSTTQDSGIFNPSQATLLSGDFPFPSTDPVTHEGQDCFDNPPASKLTEPPLSVHSVSDLPNPSSTPTTPKLIRPQSQRLSGPTALAKRRKFQADSNYPATHSSKKVKKTEADAGTTIVKGKLKPKKQSQTSIASFFTSTPPSSSQPTEPPPSSQADIIDVDDLLLSDDAHDTSISNPSHTQIPSSQTTITSNGKGKDKSTQSWSNLFARIEPPKCVVHGESAREFTVNKPGPNKGKKFYLCSRPVGPGYDAGRDKRAREDVDPRYRCNFFKWSSEVRQEVQRKRQLSTG